MHLAVHKGLANYQACPHDATLLSSLPSWHNTSKAECSQEVVSCLLPRKPVLTKRAANLTVFLLSFEDAGGAEVMMLRPSHILA